MNKKFIISITVLIGLLGLVAFWPKTTCDASGVGCRPSSQSQTKQPKAEIIQSELQNNTALLISLNIQRSPLLRFSVYSRPPLG